MLVEIIDSRIKSIFGIRSRRIGFWLALALFISSCSFRVDVKEDEEPSMMPGISGPLVPFDIMVNQFNKTAVTIAGPCPQGAATVMIKGNLNQLVSCQSNGEYSLIADMSQVADGSYDTEVEFNTGDRITIKILVDTKSPTVKNVSSPNTDGYYGLGEIIHIRVTFSEPVILAKGIPELELNIMPGKRHAIYESGSGTSDFIFKYEIQSGDLSPVLNYADNKSMKLLDSKMADAAGNPANENLPEHGWGFSLSDLSNLYISTLPPGGFFIAGIGGGNDVQFDDYLTDNSSVQVQLGNSTRSKSYKVEIWNTPLTNKICVSESSTSALVNLSVCNLTNGIYKIRATATNASGTTVSLNEDFLFTVFLNMPKVDLTGMPLTASNVINPNIVAGGTGITSYKYAIGTGTLDCNIGASYSTSIAQNTPISVDLTSLPEGTVKLCAIGSQDGVLWQALPLATTATWVKDVTAPTLVITQPLSGSLINLSNNSNSFVVAGSCNEENRTVTIKVDGVTQGTGGLCNGNQFTASINSVLLSNATHQLAAQLIDVAGNTGTSNTISIFKDNIAPSVISLSAAESDAHYSSGTIHIWVQFSEPVLATGSPLLNLNTLPISRQANYLSGSGSNQLVFKYVINNNDNSPDLDVISSSGLSLNGGTIVDQSTNPANLVISIGSLSLAGTKNIVIDTQAPTLSVTTPTFGTLIDGSNNSASFAVNGTCSEINQAVSFNVNGSFTGFDANCSGGSFNGSVDTIVLSNGTHQLFARIIDLAGNITSTNPIELIKSTAGIFVSINSPSTNSYINNNNNSTSFSITGSCSANSQPVTIKLDGVDYGAGGNCSGNAYTATIDTTTMSAGTHGLTATHFDGLGGSATSNPTNVIKNLDIPSIAITNPLNNTTINISTATNAFVVNGSCSEAGRSVSLQIDGVSAGVGGTCNGTNFSASFNTLILNQGAHQLTAIISNFAGNNNTASVVNFNIDTLAPNLAISIPSNLSFINTTNNAADFNVIGTCDEIGQTVTTKLDGTALGTNPLCTITGFSTTFDSTSLSQGTHSLFVEFSDPSGNLATSATLYLIKDTVLPTASILAPINNSFINQSNDSLNFAISGLCSEQANMVTVRVDGTTAGSGSTCSAGSFAATIDSSLLFDGSHQLFVQHQDTAGNSQNSTTVNIFKDVIAPYILAYRSPLLEANLNTGTVSIGVYSSENIISTGIPTIDLNVTPTLRKAFYQSVSSGTILNFEYIISNGDNSSDLDAASISALSLAGGSLVDSAGNNLNLTLPLTPNNMIFFNQIVIDTIAPNMPSSLALDNPTSSPGTIANPSIQIAGVSAGDTVALYSQADCLSTALSSGVSGGTAVVLTLAAPLTIGTYSFYARSSDLSGNLSACSSASVTYAFTGTGVAPDMIVFNSFGFEGSQLRFRVALDTAAASNISFTWTASNENLLTIGTADPALDLQTSTGSGLISAGSTEAYVSIDLTDDVNPEIPEHIRINISGVTGASLVENTASGIIYDPIRNVESLYGNGYNTFKCAIFTGGALKCWGSGFAGDGSKLWYHQAPVSVVGLNAGVTDVAIDTQAQNTCAIQSGTVKCWGDNNYGQVGDGTTNPHYLPFSVTLPGPAVQVSLGNGSVCALLTDESVYCWGQNSNYNLLNKAAGFSFGIYPTPGQMVDFGPGSGVTKILSDPQGYNRCLLLNNGSVKCWGGDAYGAIGNGTLGSSTTPYTVFTSGVQDLQLYNDGAMAIMSDNTVQAWGQNTYGRFGNTNSINQPSPITISALSNVSSLTMGYNFACFLLADGMVKCSGNMLSIGLGSPITLSMNIPVPIMGAGSAAKLGDHAPCIIDSAKKPKCWGYQSGGHLYQSHEILGFRGYFSPVQQMGTTNYSQTECDIIDNEVWCRGQTGLLDPYQRHPQKISGLPNDIMEVGSGATHNCARTLSGLIYCWSILSIYGQQGQGSTMSTSNPMLVVGLPAGVKAIDLSVGNEHNCAVLEDFTLWCWGRNNFGQIGITTASSALYGATQTPGLSNVAQVSTGYYNTCAKFNDGSAKCWGKSYLGNGTTTSTFVPTTPIGLASGVVDIQAGNSTSCALLSDQTVKCWGLVWYSGFTLMGDSYLTTPTTIPNLNNVISMSLGRTHSCYLTSNNKVFCAGFNNGYQLNLQDDDQSLPFPVTEVKGLGSGTIASIQSHYKSSCALFTNGKMSCWGEPDPDKSDSYEPQFLVAKHPSILKAILVPYAYSTYESWPMQIQVAATEENENTSTFNFNTNDLTALTGIDYTGISGTGTIAAGVNYFDLPTIPVPWRHDTYSSFDLMFNLTRLSGSEISRAQQSIRINDADITELEFYNASYEVGICGMHYVYADNAQVDTPVSLASSATTGTFYNDLNCTNTITTATIPRGSNYFTFYYRDIYPSTATIQSYTQLISSTATFTITGPNSIGIEGLTDLAVNTCSTGFRFKSLSATGALKNVIVNATVNLGGTGSGSFYADSGCANAVTTATISTGTSHSNIVYFKSPVAENLILTATVPWIPNAGNLPLNVRTTATPTRLDFIGSENISTGTCRKYYVGLSDSQKNPSPAGSNINFTFDLIGNGQVYKDDACLNPTSNPLLKLGMAYSSFYFKDNVVELAMIKGVTSPTLTVFPISINVGGSSGPTKVVWSSANPFEVTSGSCYKMTVRSTDDSGNYAIAQSALSYSLSASPGTFYSNSICSSQISGSTVPASANVSNFYFKTTASGGKSNLTVTWNGKSYTHVAKINSPPISLALSTTSTNVTIGECRPLTITANNGVPAPANVATNTTVNLSAGTSAAQFFTNISCGTATGTALITSGSTATSVYFKNAVAQNAIITASNAGLTTGSLSLSFNSYKLVWGGATSASTNVCTAININSKNADGTNYNVPSPLSVSLSGSGAGFFYSGSSCTGGQKITSLNINTGTSAANLWIKDNTAETLNLLATATAYTNGTQSFTMGTPPPVAPSALSWSEVNPIPQNACQNLTVITRDSNGNTANVTSNLSVTLSELGNGNFFADALCTTATNLLTVSNNSSSANIYFKDDYYREGMYQDQVTLTASASGFTDGTFEATVSGGTAHHLVWDNSLGVSSNTCVKMKIWIADAQNNKTVFSMISALNIDLTATDAGIGAGLFYTTNTCASAPVTSVSVPAAEQEVIFYYKISNVGLISFAATNNGQNGIPLTGSWLEKVIKPIDQFVVSVGATSACFISAGEIYCGGNNTDGALGQGDYLGRQGFNKVPGITDAVELASSNYGYCVRQQVGTVKCWGYNIYGTLGNGTTTKSPTPVQVLGVTNASKIVSGLHEYCVLENGGVICWGQKINGQLSTGTSSIPQKTPLPIADLSSGVTDIAVGEQNGCAVVNGGLKCWGLNYYGQLGDGTTTASTVPIWVNAFPAGSGVAKVKIHASSYLTSGIPGNGETTVICVIMDGTGELKCWGRNTAGRLGVGDSQDKTTPTIFIGMETNASDVNIATYSICAYNTLGKLLCAGKNNVGALAYNGEYSVADFVTPVRAELPDDNILGLTSTLINFYQGETTRCVLLSSKRVKCFGKIGEFWNNDLRNTLYTPTEITTTGSSSIVEVATGSRNACYRNADGEIYCWGYNGSGQLGRGHTTTLNKPTLVMSSASFVEAAYSNTCAISNDGTASCWGANYNGQLATGTTNSIVSLPTPLPIPGVGPIELVTIGENFTCALRENKIWCTGYNFYGQLGNATNTNSYVPVEVQGLPTGGTISSLKAGEHFACALTQAQLWCWGRDDRGQLSNAPGVGNSNTAGQVLGLPLPVSSFSLAGDGGYAVLNDGSLWMWGSGGSYYYPGTGYTGTTAPIRIFDSGITKIFSNNEAWYSGANYYRQCAQRVNSSRICWGANYLGNLGMGLLSNDFATGSYSYLLGFTYQMLPASAITSMRFGESFVIMTDGTKVYLAGSDVDVIGNLYPVNYYFLPTAFDPDF
jgi:alpha-tubulin suppressor-like RCC1 family protein